MLFASWTNTKKFPSFLKFYWGSCSDSFMDRGSRPEVFCKKDVVRNFTRFTGQHLCQSLVFNKAAGLNPGILLKKRLWHRCFPVNFVKFGAKPLCIEHLWWLLKNRITYQFTWREITNLIMVIICINNLMVAVFRQHLFKVKDPVRKSMIVKVTIKLVVPCVLKIHSERNSKITVKI